MKFALSSALLLALLSFLSARAVVEVPRVSSAEAFDGLKGLAGDWKIKGSNKDFRISFATTANETVLVETWHSGGTERSLTIYHLDGDRLMATHYCPQGNQPRLVAVPSTTRGQLAFEFLDVTNLSNPDDSHQNALSFDMTDPTGLVERSESYRQGGVEESSSLVLERSH